MSIKSYSIMNNPTLASPALTRPCPSSPLTLASRMEDMSHLVLPRVEEGELMLEELPLPLGKVRGPRQIHEQEIGRAHV